MDHSTIEILSRIDRTVAEIAKSMQPQNQNQSQNVTRLSRGDVVTDPNQISSAPKNISMSNVGDMVRVLNNLSPAIKLLAKLDGKTMRAFNSVINEVIKTMEKLSKFSKDNEDSLKGANEVLKVMNTIVKGINKMPLLVVTGPLALLGLTLTIPVFLLYGKLLKTLSNIKIGDEGRKNIRSLISAANPLIKFTVTATLLVAACIGLGAIVMSDSGGKLLLGGIAVLGATLLALTGIILLAGLASKLIKTTGAFQGVKEIMLLTLGCTLLVAVCMGLGAILMDSKTSKILIGGFIVLGAVLLTMGAIILLTGLLGAVIKGTGTMQHVAGILLFTFGAMAIIIAAKFLGDFVIKEYKSIAAGLGSTALVMIGLVGIGALAGKLLKTAKSGIIALGVMDAVAIGAMAVMYSASKLSEELEGKAEAVALTVLGCIGVITAFGLLAAAAGSIGGVILAGSIALGAVELFALGSVGLTLAIMKFYQAKEDAGVSWEDIGKTVLGMEAIMGTFGLLAAAFGLLVVPIALATPGILAVSAFAGKCIGVTKDIISIHAGIEDAGGIDVLTKTVSTDMPNLLKQFNAKNFKVDLSLIQIGALCAKFAALNVLSAKFAGVAVSLSKVSKVAGLVDEQGRISPVLSVNKETGEITYGEPVDIKNVANVITGALKEFVKGCDYGFDDVKKMFNAALIFGIIGTIIDPISAFVNVLTGFVGGTDANGNSTLSPVHIDKDGKITVGQPVDVKNVASIIAGTVSSFINELYKEENTGAWVEMMYGGSTAEKIWNSIAHGGKNKKTRAIQDAMGILGLLVSPVAEFVDMITGITSTDGKNLNKLVVDGEGNVKVGETVNVVNVANAIVNAVNAFMTAVYAKDKQDAWKDLAKNGTKTFDVVIKSMENFGKIMKMYSSDKDYSTTQVTKNMTGVTTILESFFGDNVKIDSKPLADSIKPLSDFSGIMVIFSNKNKVNEETINGNSKAISKFFTQTISKDMKAATPVLDKFNVSLSKTTNNLKGFDKVLKDDAEKRKKAINEFKDSIEELLQKFSGADQSISNLYHLVMTLQNMDPNRVSEVVSSLNFNGGGGGGYTQPTGTQTTTINNNTPWTNGGEGKQSSEVVGIVEALTRLFNGMKINGSIGMNGVSTNPYGYGYNNSSSYKEKEINLTVETGF